jgi:hypothetical protein
MSCRLNQPHVFINNNPDLNGCAWMCTIMKDFTNQTGIVWRVSAKMVTYCGWKKYEEILHQLIGGLSHYL